MNSYEQRHRKGEESETKSRDFSSSLFRLPTWPKSWAPSQSYLWLPGNCNSLNYTLAPKTSVSCLTMWPYEDHTTHMLIPKSSRIRSLRLYSWSKGIMPSFIFFQIRKIKVEVWGKHSSILAGSFLLSFLWPPSQSILTDNWTRNSAPGNHQPACPPIN